MLIADVRVELYPITPCVRVLRAQNVQFTPHLYRYEEHGGTGVAARELRVDEHAVIKTLVMEDVCGAALLVLMHGDREVSTKELARVLGVKSVAPCEPAAASRRTGYMVGGTSPFGTRTPLPVYAESTIFGLPAIYINGGKRGFLVEIQPGELKRVIDVQEVGVTQS